MENDGIRSFIKPLFSELLNHESVITATPDSFVPRNQKTEEFFQNVKKVLCEKKYLILKRWQTFIQQGCSNALSTHEMYLRYVMFACDKEVKFSSNVFDRILSVCALVMNFNVETLRTSSVNFCDMSVDIFMAFYKNTLKDDFYREGGFEQFAEYIRHHEYLASGNYLRDDPEKAPCPNFLKHCDIIEDDKCESLANEVLSTTKIKLPPLITSTGLKNKVQTEREEQSTILKGTSKSETMDLKRLITASSKRETHSVPKYPEETFKCEMQERDPKGKVSSSDSKEKRANTDSKGNVANRDSKGKVIHTDSKGKVIHTDSKGKVIHTDSKGKVIHTDSKGKVIHTDSKQKMLDTDKKLKSTEASSKREKKETSKCETKTISLVRKPSEKKDSKQKMTNANSERNEKTMKASLNPETEKIWSNLKTEETFLRCRANIESGTNNTMEDKTQLDRYENIVQAVIKYNKSKRSDPVNRNYEVQRIDEYLSTNKFLLDKLESIIQALEETDDE